MSLLFLALIIIFLCEVHGFLSTRLRFTNSLSVKGTESDVSIFENLVEKLKGTNIYLVGLMGSGKTTVGRKLSEKMKAKHFDTDELTEWMIEMPIPKFFDEYGEDQFRDVETTVLREICQYKDLVVSTGGGTIIKNDNWGLLRHGIVVYLNPSVSTITNRFLQDPEKLKNRPLLRDSTNPQQTLEEILHQRQEKYLQSDVNISIPDNTSIEDVAFIVAKNVIDFIDSNPPRWKTKINSATDSSGEDDESFA